MTHYFRRLSVTPLEHRLMLAGDVAAVHCQSVLDSFPETGAAKVAVCEAAPERTRPHNVVEREFVRRETEDGFEMIRELVVTPPFAESVGDHGRADPPGADVEFGNESAQGPAAASIRGSLATTPPPSAIGTGPTVVSNTETFTVID